MEFNQFSDFQGILILYATELLFLGVFLIALVKIPKYFLNKTLLSGNVRSALLVQMPLILSAMFSSWAFGVRSFWIMYVLIGFLGMTLEAGYSYYWRIFFKKPNWEYTIGAIWEKYTSIVNFLAWGGGFAMYLSVLAFLFPDLLIADFKDFSYQFFLQVAMIHIPILEAHTIFGSKQPTRTGLIEFSTFNFFLVSLPLLVPLIVTSFLVSETFFFVSLSFAIFTFVFEYLYGKYMHWMTGEMLWFYNYHTIDKQHTSYTQLIGGVAGGYAFVYIFLLILGIL